ncbi:MaoC family dehydratase [Rhodococcus koreensis]
MSDAWAKTKNGKPQVGDVTEGSLVVTPEKTQAFADISGDDNPLHFDEEVAKRSIFGELIGHGAMMVGVLNGVMVKLPGPGTVMMHADWKFLKPCRIGEEIVGRAEIIEVRDDKPMAKVRTTVTRSDGEVCLDGTVLTYVSPT